jgi:hypothetical protein
VSCFSYFLNEYAKDSAQEIPTQLKPNKKSIIRVLPFTISLLVQQQQQKAQLENGLNLIIDFPSHLHKASVAN